MVKASFASSIHVNIDREIRDLILRMYGALIVVDVDLGNVLNQHTEFQSELYKEDMYDTMHGIPGVTPTWAGTLVKEEWCVRNRPNERIHIAAIGLRMLRKR